VSWRIGKWGGPHRPLAPGGTTADIEQAIVSAKIQAATRMGGLRAASSIKMAGKTVAQILSRQLKVSRRL
jgi:hypothetical protein